MSDLLAARPVRRPVSLAPAVTAAAALTVVATLSPPAEHLGMWAAFAVLTALGAVAVKLVARSVRGAARVLAVTPASLPPLPRQRSAPDPAIAWLLDAALVEVVDA